MIRIFQWVRLDCLESDLWNFAESAAFQTRNFGFGKWPKIKCCWNLTSGKRPNKFYYRNITKYHHPYINTHLSKPAFRHAWKYIYYLREENLLQDKSIFESIALTKLLITLVTTSRYQMKGMDFIFPMIPLSFLWVYWFQYYSP